MYRWREGWIRGEGEMRDQKVCHERETEIETERQTGRGGEGDGDIVRKKKI